MEEAKRVTNGETDTADDNNGAQLNTGEVEKVIDAVNELNGGDYNFCKLGSCKSSSERCKKSAEECDRAGTA